MASYMKYCVSQISFWRNSERYYIINQSENNTMNKNDKRDSFIFMAACRVELSCQNCIVTDRKVTFIAAACIFTKHGREM